MASPMLGELSPPARPLLPDRLPNGWKLVGASLGTRAISGGTHALYLGPGATLTTGPAFVVGLTGDDQWEPRCHDGNFPGPDHWGRFRFVGGPQPEFVNETGSWAVGREVDVATLQRAVDHTRWEAENGYDGQPGDGWRPATTSVAPEAVPEGFRRVATSSAGPGEPQPDLERLRFSTPHGFRIIYLARANTAARTLARFWAVNLPGSCPRGWTGPATFVRGDLVVTTLSADRVGATDRAVIESLAPVSDAAWRQRTAGVGPEG